MIGSTLEAGRGEFCLGLPLARLPLSRRSTACRRLTYGFQEILGYEQLFF